MPSKSKSQQRLFCMAYAVRKGKLKRSEVSSSVLDVVDGSMSDEEIRDFMVRECENLHDWLTESICDVRYADGLEIDFERKTPAFAIVKPGFLDISKDIIEVLESGGFHLERMNTKRLLMSEARELYSVHRKEKFYDDLCKYMSSAPTIGLLLSSDLSGSKMVKALDKLKDEIRSKWQESDMRNVMHSSDSIENMKKESKIYF